MVNQGPIRTINSRIRNWIECNSKSHSTHSRAESLAFASFTAKFQEPTRDISAERRKAAWLKWISADESLRPKDILGPNWAEARLIVHRALSNFRIGALTFTNGSSFEPLGNNLSLACKLQVAWTITPDCFDLFAGMTFRHRGLKHAVKKRFTRYCVGRRYHEPTVNKKLWARFRNTKNPAFEIFKFKLDCVVTYVNGNRWSSVPKNNQKDRPICLEPLCNMLVQRAIGLGIRASLMESLGIDLDNLADVHRLKICDSTVATIDLSDCSDAISLKLIKYLLPSRVLKLVLASRSDMTLGLDGDYYITRKVSSMGNGFTFDLMSLVLTALARSFDKNATVFGDDIICQNQVGLQLVEALQVAGFTVNASKTFIESDYRESCGSHYIDNLGYITVFDQRWLCTPHDIVVTLNKVAILSYRYGGIFEALRRELWVCVPPILLGATVERPTEHIGRPLSYELDTYVRYGPRANVAPSRSMLKTLRRALAYLQKPGNISIAQAFVNKLDPGKTTLRSADWDVYLMYLHNIRRAPKWPRLTSKSTFVARVDEEQIGFVKALLPARE